MALTDEQHIELDDWLQREIRCTGALAEDGNLYTELRMSFAQQKLVYLRVQDKLKDLT